MKISPGKPFLSAFYLAVVALSFTIGCADEQSIEFRRYYALGKNLYEKHCQNCHGKNGEGLSALYPPLSDTLFLRQNRDSLACWISNGMEKEITIKGKTYREKMPADTDTTPIEIAQIITYITNAYGNKQGLTDHSVVNRQLENCR